MILTPVQLQQWLDERRALTVLDVRPVEQRNAIPLTGLEATAAPREGPFPSEGRTLILVCEVGIVTEEIIAEHQLDDAWSLLGGAQAWQTFVDEKTDLSRWSRQTALPELGVGGQMRLRDGSVAVVGLGGLGCPAAQALAAAGVGRLILVDGDRVELSNLHRQPLFAEDDVGRFKVAVAAERLQGLNADLAIRTEAVFLDNDNAVAMLEGVDVVLDATDNLAARRALDAAARRLDLPLVYGALYRFEGQVAVLNHRGGPSYADVFPGDDEAAATCADAGVLGMLSGIIGNIQALEAVKLLAGLETSLSGRLLIYDGLGHDITIIELGQGS